MLVLKCRLSLLLVLFFLLQPAFVFAAEEKGRFFGGRETEYPEWFKESFLDLREDINESAEAGRRVVIFFHQDGCPYCHLLVERNLSQKDIQGVMRQQMDVIAVNMFGDREVTALNGEVMTEKAFAAMMRVQFTPTLLFFDEGGRVILRLNGYIPPQNFKLALDYVAGRMERTASYREYLVANRPTEPRGALNSEDYYMQPPFNLALRGQRPLAVFFEQVQCPDCDRLHREVLADPDIRALLQKFDVVQLDMWSQTPVITPQGERLNARTWARQLGVNFAPTFILFGIKGEEIIRSEAVFKRFHTESILDYAVSGAYRQQPSFQRYLSSRAEHIREQGKDVNIWQ